MATPFFGEIKMISWNFAPKGWAFCNGQMLPINQNQALFSLFGTAYGGNGTTTFGLPNLQGAAPVHRGTNQYSVGEAGGEATHTLSIQEMAAHVHAVNGSSASADQHIPTGYVFGTAGYPYYKASLSNPTSIDPTTVQFAGGGQSHNNMQPYLVLNFIVALSGVYPPRS